MVWGRDDAELRAETFGQDARAALGLERDVHLVDGKHFLQENSPLEIAERIALLIDKAKTSDRTLTWALPRRRHRPMGTNATVMASRALFDCLRSPRQSGT